MVLRYIYQGQIQVQTLERGQLVQLLELLLAPSPEQVSNLKLYCYARDSADQILSMKGTLQTPVQSLARESQLLPI